MIKTVLITGGLGYIGGRIAQALAQEPDFFPVATTRQTTAELPTWLSKGKVLALDLMSDAELRDACTGVDCVVHLAAMNEIESVLEPESALVTNGLGSLKLLRAAIVSGVRRFVYFSTAHVYGAPLEGEISEATIARPAHPYAITHRTAEDFVLAAHDQRKIEGVVVRLSNGIGAPAHPSVNRWTLIANDLCRQAVTSGKLTLRSSGLQRRDFITLKDVGEAVLHLLRLPMDQLQDGLFNLGGEMPLRIIDLAEHIADRCEQVFGFRPPIERPAPEASDRLSPLDYRIDKIKATGFQLKGQINSEIDATLLLCRAAFERG